MNGIYIHLPFCRSKCHYCDFYSFIPETRGASTSNTIEALGRSYAEAVIRHVNGWAEANRRFLKNTPPTERFQTVFFGGGTPSYMPIPSLEKICRALEEKILGRSLGELDEVSIEANPESFSRSQAEAYHALGINRISMGVQALSSQGLSVLGREASLDATLNGLEILAEAPQKYKSADLIFGYPGQTKEELFGFLTRVVNYGLDHISLYGLTLEKGTEYARLVATGRAEPPDDDFIGSMYGPAGEHLAGLGLERYEISNFARPGHWCRHNLIYWSLMPYLGFGVSAHGLWNGVRYKSSGSLQAYLKQEAYYQSTDDFEPALELALTRLRLTGPIALAALKAPLSAGQRREVDGVLENWRKQGYIKILAAEDLTSAQNAFVALTIDPEFKALAKKAHVPNEARMFMIWEKEALPFFDTRSLEFYRAVST